MRARCNNPNHRGYPNYGGRGITVCERWNNFETFCADIGPRPEKCTLDRIDNNLCYSPDNCQWSTREDQAKNKRFTPTGNKQTSEPFIQKSKRGYSIRVTINSGIRINQWSKTLKEAREKRETLIFERDFYRYHNITLLKD